MNQHQDVAIGGEAAPGGVSNITNFGEELDHVAEDLNPGVNGCVHAQHLGVLLCQDVVEADVALDLALVVDEL